MSYSPLLLIISIVFSSGVFFLVIGNVNSVDDQKNNNLSLNNLIDTITNNAGNTELKNESTKASSSTTKINFNLNNTNAQEIKAQPNLEDITPQITKTTKNTEPQNDRIEVPFYSQFNDITSPSRKKIGCGVASLAMLIELYRPNEKISVDNLFEDGVQAGAYLNDAGWIHAGLINLSKKYGLDGQSHSLANKSADSAFEKLKIVLNEGPVMASVHYTFEPTNPIPHLVVINSVSSDGNTVYYNDPAENAGNGSISKEKFIKAWKKRYIEIRPV